MASPRPSPKSEPVRLQKYLASCGVASRRASEKLIEEGAVRVDGVVVSTLGAKVDPACQEVRVHGKPVRPERFRYVLLNKPRDVLCTCRDPRGRRTVLDVLPPMKERLVPAGRLDGDSEGLLLLTNDGRLVNRLIHPRHHVEKVYRVWLDRPLAEEDRDRLCAGMEVEGERMTVDRVREAPDRRGSPCFDFTLHEGRNRQIRRMWASLGYQVHRLLRVRFGPLRPGNLRRGQCRELTAAEVRALRKDG